MKTWLLGSFCFLLILQTFAQEKYTLSGYLTHSENGEALIGATVLILDLGTGSVTNSYGFYSITLPKGDYRLEFRYVGFKSEEKNINLTQDLRMDVALTSTEELLEEVVVKGNTPQQQIMTSQMSVSTLEIKTLERLPAFAGEVDILKGIQFLPGVSTVGEGAAGFNVRGGSVGQNLVLLDEAPVYQSSHLFGFFSVFNPDAVKDIKLYKGGIPSRYGGRLSSVLDIYMKEGNSKKYQVKGGLGTIFSRLAIEGPIQKDKSSFLIAGRRSYADILAKPFTDQIDENTNLYFYDLTAKTNFILNENNRIFFSGYFGKDIFKFDEFQGFDWGNQTATIRWNHLYGKRLFSNVSAIYSNYGYGFQFGSSELDNFDWSSQIQTANLKADFAYSTGDEGELNFGLDLILYDFLPAKAKILTKGIPTDVSLDQRKGLETSLYAAHDFPVSEKFLIQYGARLSRFQYMGGTEYTYADTVPGIRKRLVSTRELDTWESISEYTNLEPRFSFRYQLDASSSLKGSYNRMNQYIHLISNTTVSTPIDIWQPSTNLIKPQQGDQVALGYFKNLMENRYELSVEGYYKWSRNLVDYIDGADLFINEYLESVLLFGKGRSYGMEIYAKKNSGKITGWVSYTLGKSEMIVDGINYGTDKVNRKGQWYPTRFDQRHNLKLAAFYELKKNLSLSANFSFLSGTPSTFPTDRIYVGGYVIPYIARNQRNNFRIPDYHRLDLAATFENVWRGKKGRSGTDSMVVSIYNVYGRQNPFSVYFSQGTERPAPDTLPETTATKLSIIGTFLPAFSYNFNF
ncbi:TonB-dependent receptor [Algoriphagus confluentis]|uniref:TonB-dependent receptor n=1 Tax=Algoriphagus confluentis TaxID=1697556 RepID=A0ABQ6PTT6_9BACT|nr:TonB-dependent receptor [Algoriphagus confluentis]